MEREVFGSTILMDPEVWSFTVLSSLEEMMTLLMGVCGQSCLVMMIAAAVSTAASHETLVQGIFSTPSLPPWGVG